ncbi:MAG: carbohydrate kinase family protein [Opitutaceae bacterium]
MMATNLNESRCGVLAAGNWIVDRVKIIDRWPQQDALAMITEQSESNGGCAYNMLKDLALLGCGFPLHACGRIGADADGAVILADLAALGIDSRGLIRTDDFPTSYTDVMTVESSGRRTFFHQKGANAVFSEEDCALREFPARIFHLGYFGLLDLLDETGADGRNGHEHLLARASELGFLTSADLVTDESRAFDRLVAPVLPHLDFLFLNEVEGELLSGISARNPDASGGINVEKLEAQARHAIQGGVRRAVVVHCAEGVVGVTADGVVHRHGAVRVPAGRIRGAAGAGDALSAGVLLGVHENWPLIECLELGVCAAALSLEASTCSAGLRPWRECLENGRSLGFRAF